MFSLTLSLILKCGTFSHKDDTNYLAFISLLSHHYQQLILDFCRTQLVNTLSPDPNTLLKIEPHTLYVYKIVKYSQRYIQDQTKKGLLERLSTNKPLLLYFPLVHQKYLSIYKDPTISNYTTGWLAYPNCFTTKTEMMVVILANMSRAVYTLDNHITKIKFNLYQKMMEILFVHFQMPWILPKIGEIVACNKKIKEFNYPQYLEANLVRKIKARKLRLKLVSGQFDILIRSPYSNILIL